MKQKCVFVYVCTFSSIDKTKHQDLQTFCNYKFTKRKNKNDIRKIGIRQRAQNSLRA